LSQFRLPPFWEIVTFCPDLRLGWGLKQTCRYRRELFNGMSHSPCTHRDWVDSRLLVVRNQITSLTPGPSFCHNLRCKRPNGSCKFIYDIYASIAFQWYKECFNVRCFDPCNRPLKFWESRQTLKFPFRECESHPHTLLKVGLRHV
jgi:hypothetical protein